MEFTRLESKRIKDSITGNLAARYYFNLDSSSLSNWKLTRCVKTCPSSCQQIFFSILTSQSERTNQAILLACLCR